MSIEEGERLLPMRGIIGGIQVDGDALGPLLQPRPMVRDHRGRQGPAHPGQRPRAHRVLKPRQGGLRGQGGAQHRIPSHGQFVQRIVRQPGGVVRILVATGQAKDPLAQQIAEWMTDLVGISAIDQTPGQPIGHLELVIQRFEQHRPAIGTGLGLIEPGDHRLQVVVEFERHLRYTVCRHRGSSSRASEASEHRSYSTDGSLDGSFISRVVNYPG